jgi:hypothetical protein
MPFTVSHAVVALPFARTALAPAAVAVGAMAPDLPLFVRGIPLDYGTTHDPAWLPLTVVIALALLLVWRMLLRPAVRGLVPRALAARLPADWDAGAGTGLRETFARRGARRPSAAGAALVLAALAIGVLSHIVWDEFTHEGRAGTALMPALADPWGPLAGYRWLQYGSGAAGLAILAVWAVLWLRRRTPDPAVPRALPAAVRVAWLAALPALVVVALVVAVAADVAVGEEPSGTRLAYGAVVPACTVWILGTLALAIVVQLRRPRTA